MSIKTSQTKPHKVVLLLFYFNRQTTPEINLWPVPENSTDVLRYYYVQRIEDADALVNDVDAPFRFLPCMASGLAYYLSVKRAPDRVQLLKTIYEEEFQRAADEDEDRVPLETYSKYAVFEGDNGTVRVRIKRVWYL